MKRAKIFPIYNLNNYLDKRGEAPICIRVYFDRKRRIIPTGISVPPENWDQEKSQVIGHPYKGDYNSQIKAMVSQFEVNQNHLVREKENFTIDEIIHYHQADKKKKELSFSNYIMNDLETRADLRPGTRRNHQSFIARIQEFKRDILFEEIDYELILRFEAFLRNYQFTKGSEVKNLQLTRIAKFLKAFHSYVRRAIKRGLMPELSDPFKNFSWGAYYKAERQASKKRKHLTEKDVEALEKLKFPKTKAHLGQIRDFFLMQCYTGLAYSDLIRVTRNNIYDESYGPDGSRGLVIRIDRKKTDEPVFIPVFKMFRKAEDLLKKYLKENRPFLFDRFTDQHINRELKKIAEMAGIRDKITTHVGRHTCAMLLIRQGKPMHVISKILGHTNIKTTEIYAMIDDEAIANAF